MNYNIDIQETIKSKASFCYSDQVLGYGIFKNWKRQFLSLWNDSILYLHRDDASSTKFYNM